MQKVNELLFGQKTSTLGVGVLDLWVIETIRIGFYFFVVATSIIAQILNPYFLNFNIWLPVYVLVILGLSLHFLVIFSYQKIKHNTFLEVFIFILDIIFISAFSYYTYLSYPIFTVLYLVNIILCSFTLGSAPGFLIAGVSVLFYTLVYLSRVTETNTDQISYLLNLITFYSSAVLAGYLGDLLSFRSKELAETKSDLFDLRNLSQIIVKNIGVGLISYESDKNISFANEAAKNILGSKLDSENEFVKNQILFQDTNSGQHTRREEVELDLWGIKKNLEFITTFISSSEMKTRWVLLVQDLTEIKSLQKELMMKEKLAAIGQLAGGIAHEIRNPLASISGSVEMLKESTADLNQENTKLFSIIIREIDRLNLLITDFLSFVRPEVKRSDDASMKDLVDEILTLIKFDKNLSTNVTFKVDLPDVKIKCDKPKLKQAFINIITNALQAMKNHPNPEFTCTAVAEKYFIDIEFKDNGSGIPQAIVQRIFEPFYTTKEKGTGLGLAITHRIIEGHEGTIKVNSEEKKGTTFFIRLPIK